MADVAGLDRIGNRADRFFNRHGWIEPARTVNVDVIGPEPAQCVGEKVLHGDGPRIHAEPGARRIAHRTELDADDCALSPSAKGLPDQQLVMRSEEHTSELQSLTNLVCRLLLEKKNKKQNIENN